MRMEGKLDAAFVQAYSIGWLGTAGHTVAHTEAFLEWVILQHFCPYSEGWDDLQATSETNAPIIVLWATLALIKYLII